MNKSLLATIVFGLGLAWTSTANAQIKLGVMGPITGPNAAFGAQVKTGVEQGVDDINSAGGVLGQKIAVSVGDDASDAKKGVLAANKFVGDGVKLAVGPINSGVALPVTEVFADNGILFITPAATST